MISPIAVLGITSILIIGITIFITTSISLTDYTLTSMNTLERVNDRVREDLNATAIIVYNPLNGNANVSISVTSNWTKESSIKGVMGFNANNLVCTKEINQTIPPLTTSTLSITLDCSTIPTKVILITGLGNSIVAN